MTKVKTIRMVFPHDIIFSNGQLGKSKGVHEVLATSENFWRERGAYVEGEKLAKSITGTEEVNTVDAPTVETKTIDTLEDAGVELETETKTETEAPEKESEEIVEEEETTEEVKATKAVGKKSKAKNK